MSGIVDRIVDKFGTQSALAEGLGCDQSTISHWKNRNGDLIPADRQRKILALAKNRGIDLSPADFFPREAA